MYCIFCGKNLDEIEGDEILISTAHFDNEHADILRENKINSLEVLWICYIYIMRENNGFKTDN